MSLLSWLGLTNDDVDGDGGCPDPDCDCAPHPDCDCPVCADLWLTCVHEMGHVAAHLHYDDPFHSVVARPDFPNHAEGITRNVDDGHGQEEPDEWAARMGLSADEVFEEMVSSAAGSAAERHHYGAQQSSNTGDDDAIAALAALHGGSVDDAHHEADALVAEWWGWIDKAAQALFYAHELTADEVESL